MPVKGVIFDQDCKQLVQLLLRSHAKNNAGYRRYNNIGEQLQFEIANRALATLGYQQVGLDPLPEAKS